MTLDQYISNINYRYRLGNATEHTFRGDLQQLIESLVPGVNATNEPKRQKCGAPDYIITRKEIPVGFIEAKDIGDNDLDGLKKTGNKEQFDRYKVSLGNLFFTDYLDFHLYREGVLITTVAIGEIKHGTIVPLPNNFAPFTNLLKDFCSHIGQTIKSSKKLAEMMASKARLLAEVIEKALNSDESNNQDSTLKEQMYAFKDILIHDITPKGFADVYAQTVAYGLFAARLHDPTLPTFSRGEAAELIPKSNPFLRKLFGYIAGPDIDDRIKWIVDSLIDVFLACNVEELLKDYGKATKMEDPIIHFYETFLSEYDPKLRKARGVWYTPQPVVNFIVRAVDDILKTEFNLPQGLADTSKTKIKRTIETKATADRRSKVKQEVVEEEVHKVQILDPATGTGTFLAEVIKHIHKKFTGQQGIWSNYVESHLLPRLNGFELLMASYAMAHLKLDLLLTETGYKPTKDQRFKVYLTNSLEEHHPDTGTLFANWLSSEANEANHIKRDAPVMCIIGNPPYSIASSNLSKTQRALVEKYKFIDSNRIKEKGALQLEKNLNDDYVKFIALGESYINKNGEGILAFINNNNFLDAITLRGMRWNLLNTFDTLYIIDAHGNYMKKEISPDGNRDENIFDIQQGVSINIFVKTGKKKEGELGTVNHYDLFGKRENKYNFLSENSIKTIPFKKLNLLEPKFYLVHKDFETSHAYNEGIELDKLFLENVTGVKTHRDGFIIGFSKGEIAQKIKSFYDKSYSDEQIKNNFGLKDTGTWKVNKARSKGKFSEQFFEPIHYRPFDTLNIYYDPNLIDCSRINVMQHFIGNKSNIGLIIPRQAITDNWSHVQLTTSIIDNRIHYSNKGTPICCPLYLYTSTKGQQTTEQTPHRVPNLQPAIIDKISNGLGLAFQPEKGTNDLFFSADEDEFEDKVFFAPIDLLDYIYAVLHSPSYREKYKEFLKIDFPRVPYPKDKNVFWNLVKLGSKIRKIHLLEDPILNNYITEYPIAGDNVVSQIKFLDGRVFINETQYFANVPAISWQFYFGGYQPAQKWLKDRRDRKLEFEDILHYQRMIVALMETSRIMDEIDQIEI